MAPVDKKRRKKRSRIDDASSSSSEDSDNAMVVDAMDEPSDLSDNEVVEEPVQEAGELPGRELRHKAPQQSEDNFSQYFLSMVTAEFGEDLEKLRQANDFVPESLSQLVAGLKNGVNIFSEEQRRTLLADKK